MGSSSGDDYSVPPQQPAPPGNLISPMGTSTPYQPNFINFLGDTNTPSTGLTPQMLAAIAASNGPPPGPPMMMGGGGGMPPQQQQPGGLTPDEREGLARLMAGAPPKAPPGIGRANPNYPGGGTPRRFEGGGGANRGGYGSSAGGRYG